MKLLKGKSLKFILIIIFVAMVSQIAGGSMANNQILKSIVDNYMNVLHEGDFEEAKRYCTIDCDMKDIFEKKLSDEEVLINEFGDEVIDEYKETKKVYYNILCGKYEITKIEKM